MFSNTPVDNQQKISKKPVRAGICNEDLAYGNYVAVPREVLDLVASGKMPLAKFKVLALLLKNNADFHVKYQYLANRMVPRTIAKYIPELIEDGYIYVEKDHNGLVHHDINPIHFWKPLQHILFDDLENYQGRFRVGMAGSKFRINNMDVEAKRKVYCMPIWNDFIEEWAKGHISNSAFRLFIAIATVSDRLHVKRDYLKRCGFDSRTIKKARIELEQGGYIWTDITKKGVIWNMNRIADWNIFKGKVNLPIAASVSPLQDNTHGGTPSNHAVAELDGVPSDHAVAELDVAELDGVPSDHAVAELDVAELDVPELDHNNTPANKTLGNKNQTRVDASNGAMEHANHSWPGLVESSSKASMTARLAELKAKDKANAATPHKAPLQAPGELEAPHLLKAIKASQAAKVSISDHDKEMIRNETDKVVLRVYGDVEDRKQVLKSFYSESERCGIPVLQYVNHALDFVEASEQGAGKFTYADLARNYREGRQIHNAVLKKAGKL